MLSEKPENSATSLAIPSIRTSNGSLPKGRLSFRQGGRDVVIAVETGNLLSQISHAEQVMTEGRCNDLSLLSVITEINLLEVRKHILLGNIGSQKGVDALRLERNANRLFFLRVNVYHAANYLTRAQLLDQLAGTVDGILRIVGIQALLELTAASGSAVKVLRNL